MFKEDTLRQAFAWAPQTASLKPVGAPRLEISNDEPFMPPPPPTLEQCVGNFGGRQRRYQVQRHQQLRVYDPFLQEYVTFGHERYLLAWLLMRFSPRVTELETSPAPVGYMCAGRPTMARPHLTWRIVGANRRVFFWLRKEWTEEEHLRYAKFSATHGVDVVLSTWTELGAQKQLLENLQAGRQQMTTVQQAGLDIRPIAREILSHLRAHKGLATRGELGAELRSRGCLDFGAQVDASLFHLHAVGRLRLDLDDTAFGDDTRVHSG
jgi:hypothetical protein